MSARKRREFWNTSVESAFLMGGAEAAWALVDGKPRKAVCPECRDFVALRGRCSCCAGHGVLEPGKRPWIVGVDFAPTGRSSSQRPNLWNLPRPGDAAEPLYTKRYNAEIILNTQDRASHQFDAVSYALQSLELHVAAKAGQR